MRRLLGGVLVLVCGLSVAAEGQQTSTPLEQTLRAALRSRQADPMPIGELSIAYQQKENGKLGEAVHILTFRCADWGKGLCSTTTLTLNQCIGGAFYPKVEVNGEVDGSLTVERVMPNELVLRFDDGAQTQIRMSYRTTETVGVIGFDGGVAAFSGAAVKDSAILRKVISWELVPFTVRNQLFKNFNCPADLPFLFPR